jgi:hypothetical protein
LGHLASGRFPLSTDLDHFGPPGRRRGTLICQQHQHPLVGPVEAAALTASSHTEIK